MNENDDVGVADVSTPVKNLIFYLLVFLFMTFLLWESTELNRFESKFLPLITIYSALGLCILGISKILFLEKAFEDVSVTEGIRRTLEKHEAINKRIVAHLAFLLLISVSTVTLGVFTTSFIVGGAYVYITRRNGREAALTAVLISLALYVLFIQILGFSLLLNEDPLMSIVDRLLSSII